MIFLFTHSLKNETLHVLGFSLSNQHFIRPPFALFHYLKLQVCWSMFLLLGKFLGETFTHSYFKNSLCSAKLDETNTSVDINVQGLARILWWIYCRCEFRLDYSITIRTLWCKTFHGTHCFSRFYQVLSHFFPTFLSIHSDFDSDQLSCSCWKKAPQ